MNALAQIEWEACVLPQGSNPVLERHVRDAMGTVPPLIPYFYDVPWVVRSMVAFDESQLTLLRTESALARLIGLVVAQESSCRFCFAASRALLRIHGMREDNIEQIEQDLHSAQLSAGVKAGLEFARRIARANPLPTAADRQQLLDAGNAPEAVAELVFLSAVNVFYNRLATLPAIPPESIERIARSRLLAILRPILVRVALPRRRRRGVPASTEAYHGPYAYLADRFGESPLAVTLAQQLRDAWGESPLPRRTKALLFAVVAHGVDCPISLREAERVLAEDGMAGADVRQTLEHLASPRLDPVEQVLVPYARETIWFRPAQVQRRTRVVQAQLTHEQFLDAIGVVSLANAVCRMNVAFTDGE